LDKDIDVSGRWVTKETLKDDKEIKKEFEESVRKMKKDMADVFEDMPK
jgi:hypothetical protein